MSPCQRKTHHQRRAKRGWSCCRSSCEPLRATLNPPPPPPPPPHTTWLVCVCVCVSECLVKFCAGGPARFCGPVACRLSPVARCPLPVASRIRVVPCRAVVLSCCVVPCPRVASSCRIEELRLPDPVEAAQPKTAASLAFCPSIKIKIFPIACAICE